MENRIIGTGSSTQKSEPMYLSPMIPAKQGSVVVAKIGKETVKIAVE